MVAWDAEVPLRRTVVDHPGTAVVVGALVVVLGRVHHHHPTEWVVVIATVVVVDLHRLEIGIAAVVAAIVVEEEETAVAAKEEATVALEIMIVISVVARAVLRISDTVEEEDVVVDINKAGKGAKPIVL